jgi:hypothetical protein
METAVITNQNECLEEGLIFIHQGPQEETKEIEIKSYLNTLNEEHKIDKDLGNENLVEESQQSDEPRFQKHILETILLAKDSDSAQVQEKKVDLSEEQGQDTEYSQQRKDKSEEIISQTIQQQSEGASEAKKPSDKEGYIYSQIKALMGVIKMKSDGIPEEILPGFYLGSIGAALNKKILEEHKIQNILCCCDGIKDAYPQLFAYKTLKLLDIPTEDISRYFEEAADYIHGVLIKEQKVLVHCFAGKSRSTTIMICYLIKYKSMTVDEALQLIRKKRAIAQPNMGFLRQLREYEKKIKGN